MSNINNSSFRQVSVKRLCTYEGVSGNAGQFLRSTGSSFEWGNGSGGSGFFTEQIQSAGGAINDLSMDSPSVVLKCIGANTVLSGMSLGGVSPSGGDVVILYNNSNSPLQILHQSSLSAAGNRIICPSITGQWLGNNGSVMATYDSGSSRWLLEVLNPGDEIQLAFDANIYGVEGTAPISITVEPADFVKFGFVQFGNTINLTHIVNNFTLSGAGTIDYVTVDLPYAWDAYGAGANSPRFLIYRKNNNAEATGMIIPTGGSIQIYSTLASLSTWVNGANNNSFNYSISFQIF